MSNEIPKPTREMVEAKTMRYGAGLGRELERNAQVTTSGGLGFWRGTIGGGFSPGVGRGYPHDTVKPHWPRALATPPQPRPTIPL
ncbi:hypothetical protein HanXRQr2_Chr16g0777821 [Helianthus annuus]|uniref:Uncharacterized protein n=2 Tax=Helianthus annuus TaxID=4232 RepID=A0A9K3H0G2_HELAN|nr:hypothetical protein HanXRQr2_Chr16g0777821 [Helianthus annuus]